jgi:uncharacterized protein (TIGR01777 family)
MNILITGGTGLIGSGLQQALREQNHDVALLSRRSGLAGTRSFHWDIGEGKLDPAAIEYADVIVHLAGENIGSGRWTPIQKKRIVESRVRSGLLLVDAIRKATDRPRKLIGASAIGYYGMVTTDRIFRETDPPGNDFLADTVVQWERSLDGAADMGVPVQRVRIGVVLSEDSVALNKLAAPVKLGMAAALGSGRQWMPWISLRDLSRLFLFLTEKEIPTDVFNAVSPQHINNLDFMKTLAKVLNRPFFLPNVPGIVLKMALGEMASTVLEGSRVSPEKIQQLGFIFQDTDLASTLKRMLHR